MQFPIGHVTADIWPPLLREIPDPPVILNYRGDITPLSSPLKKNLAVVGSRKYSDYGKQITELLMSGLRGYPVNIISGLALGIDSIAHRAALNAHLYTCAVPGSGIEDGVIYPKKHKKLAHEILDSGGALLSEFAPETAAAPWTFPQRNRIMAGLSHATLVIEATEKSGTLITARLTADYNRELLVVPGDITRASSKGPHQFLKLGATPITSADDIIEVLGIQKTIAATEAPKLLPEEELFWNLLTEPKNVDTLIIESQLEPSVVNITLMQMVVNGIINSDGELFYRNH